MNAKTTEPMPLVLPGDRGRALAEIEAEVDALLLRHPTADAGLTPATRAVLKRHLTAGAVLAMFERDRLSGPYEEYAERLLRQAVELCQMAEQAARRRDVAWIRAGVRDQVVGTPDDGAEVAP